MRCVTSYLDVFANATWLDAKITRSDTQPLLAGKTMSQIPDYLYNVGLDLHAAAYRGSLTLRGVGDAFSRDDNLDFFFFVRGCIEIYTSLDGKVIYAGWDK